MKYLKSYKIFEVRGYMSDLEIASDEIISQIDKDNFSINVKTKKGNFDVDITVLNDNDFKKIHGYDSMAICLFDPLIKKSNIVLNRDNILKSTIIHELKHAFSHKFNSQKQLKINWLINTLQNSANNTYSQFFKADPKYVSMILYYLNKEEIEAHYQGFAYDVSSATLSYDNQTRKMTSIEKKEYIDSLLRNSLIFNTLRFYKNGDFKFENMFKSEKKMNLFFDLFKDNMSEKASTPFWRAFDILKIFFGKSKNDYSKVVKDINYEVNKNCKIYYKKYMRLYTL